jgi:hypothetical protein
MSVKNLINEIENKLNEPVKTVIKCELKEKNAKYYEVHREEIIAFNKEMTKCCLCDKDLRRGSLRSHQKSKLCTSLCDLKIRKQKMINIIQMNEIIPTP